MIQDAQTLIYILFVLAILTCISAIYLFYLIRNVSDDSKSRIIFAVILVLIFGLSLNAFYIYHTIVAFKAGQVVFGLVLTLSWITASYFSKVYSLKKTLIGNLIGTLIPVLLLTVPLAFYLLNK